VPETLAWWTTKKNFLVSTVDPVGTFWPMSVHPPIVSRYVPPSREEAEASRARAEGWREEIRTAWEAGSPARRTTIEAGPALRDVDAAVKCHCSCHPRPADPAKHDGGTSCPCQDTEADRSARRAVALSALSELAESVQDEERSLDARREGIIAEADSLGVTARIEVWAAPFVIVGVCNGRGFYLRERHGDYRVTISGDDDPASDPWTADRTETSIDIAAGDDRELTDGSHRSDAVALRVAVNAVRTALARNECAHRSVLDGPHCPSCGVRLTEADAWRWSVRP
jgi:hypothetical protein